MIAFENDEDGYLRWMRSNRNGFVLARRSNREAVLHAATCSHLDDGGSYARTKKAKLCAADSAELRQWASEHGVTVTTCSDC
jgi:hypothetical protein